MTTTHLRKNDGTPTRIPVWPGALLLTVLIAGLCWPPAASAAAKAEDCLTPPSSMIGWWPFDEFNGPTAADVAQNNDGNYINSPIPVFGQVGGAIDVDTQGSNDWIEVPHDASLDVGSGDFSIDAWISPSSLGTFLSKHDGTAGYELAVDLIATPTLMVTVEGSGGGFEYQFCTSFNWGWRHIVVTVDRGSNTTRCYVDGVLSGTIGDPITGSIDNTASLKVGKGVATFATDFAGKVDELELFDRELTATEAADLFQIGAFGKCKEGGHAPWDKPFCLNANSVVVNTTVCNYNTSAQTYSIDSLAPLPIPFHPQCNIPGPTSFTVLDSSVNVAPASCGTLRVRVDRPAGMTSVNTIGCYEVTFRNNGTGALFTHPASVWDTRDRCTSVITVDEADFALMEVGEVRELLFVVRDTTGRDSAFPFEVQVVPSDMLTEGREIPISLDGQEPGTPVRGELVLEANGQQEIAVAVEVTELDAFRYYDILLVADPQGEQPQILQSTGVRSVAPAESEAPGPRRFSVKRQ